MHTFRPSYVDGYGRWVPNSATRLETHHRKAVRKQMNLRESISKQNQWTSLLEKGSHPSKWGTRSDCWNNKSDSSLSSHTASTGHHFQPLVGGSKNSNNTRGTNVNRSCRSEQVVIVVIIVLLSIVTGLACAYGLSRGGTMVPHQLQDASSVLTKMLDLAW